MVNRLSNDLRDAAQFRVLNAIALHPDYSQRQLSRVLGVSVGRVNACLRALREGGLVTVGARRREPGRRGAVLALTPAGMAERSRLTQRFLQRRLAEYAALRREIAELRAQMDLPGLATR